MLDKANELLSRGYSNIDFKELDALYFEVFGKKIDGGCGACVMGAYQDLLKWKRAQTFVNKKCMYKFSKEYENKAIILYNNGVKIVVTKDNLNDSIAEMILSNPKFKSGILIKTDVEEVKEKKILSKALMESVTSTLTEVEKEENESKENLTDKESEPSESEPLMDEPKKRRGRPKKS